MTVVSNFEDTIQDDSCGNKKQGSKMHKKWKLQFFYVFKYGHENLANGSLPGNEPFPNFLSPYSKKIKKKMQDTPFFYAFWWG